MTSNLQQWQPRKWPAKEFVENKTSDKEVADSGIKSVPHSGLVKIPRTFILPPSSVQCSTGLMDLKFYQRDRRREIVDEMRKASETCGIFQVIKHGIPISVCTRYWKVFKNSTSSLRRDAMGEYVTSMLKLRYSIWLFVRDSRTQQ
ncbi:Non-hem dioxygenase N-terminal domain [Dillenia turbinata]|uniref:Non-hem dioxygenase N-terminal domain n=1 Tax=Dillenia turbinata TaxID=194707 RepID=A0AAN8W2C2_9MAGN